MTQEEKAKAYDEALKVIKECNPDENGFITIYPQEIFPELKSEDEKIRKGLLSYFKKTGITKFNWMDAKRIIAWLEKQKEPSEAYELGYTEGMRVKNQEWLERQKPLEWSEKDERNINRIETLLYCFNSSMIPELSNLIDWLRSLRPPIKSRLK